jgi:hypothetical protein
MARCAERAEGHRLPPPREGERFALPRSACSRFSGREDLSQGAVVPPHRAPAAIALLLALAAGAACSRSGSGGTSGPTAVDRSPHLSYATSCGELETAIEDTVVLAMKGEIETARNGGFVGPVEAAAGDGAPGGWRLRSARFPARSGHPPRRARPARRARRLARPLPGGARAPRPAPPPPGRPGRRSGRGERGGARRAIAGGRAPRPRQPAGSGR